MKRRQFLGSAAVAAAAVASLPARKGLSGLYRPSPQVPPDIDAVTGAGTEITIRGSDIADLVRRMHGRVLLPEEPGYDEARLLLNPSFDKYPALVVQPTGSADVQIAVDFARELELLVAVKCGGHSLSGKSSCDGGLQIDLSRFRGVRVDPVARRAWVDGGSLLGLVDHEAMQHGLVTPLGTVSHTGVGGLTLGGGFGRVARKFGLAIDNVRAFDIVTADGELRRASPDVNRDLYWGLRGGGGNFGVVTSFEFALHPMERQVVGGMIFFPLAHARDVLKVYAEYGAEAPDDLYMDYVMVLPPGGEDGIAGFSVCYSGPHDRAELALAPIRGIGTPIVDQIEAVDYVALQRSGDIDDPRAMGTYFKGGFVSGIPDGLISAIVENFEGDPRRSTQLFFQHAGGAIGRVRADATAFPHRYAFGNMMTSVDWRFGQDPSAHIDWLRGYWAELELFTAGFYANDVGLETSAAEVNANYRENYPRLVELKDRYDPGNLFRLNANVRPSA